MPKDVRHALRRDYLLMCLTNRELAQKYHVHPNTICNLAKADDWDELRELISAHKFLEPLLSHLSTLVETKLVNPRNQSGSPEHGSEDEEDAKDDGEGTFWSF